MIFEPRVFTFYSYKGGVGRSMALLNLGYYLQSRGRHVLMVDMDLEAPGVSGFLERNDELLPATPGGKDVVDLLGTVINAVRSHSEQPPVPKVTLDDYLRKVRPDKYAPPAHPRAPRTRLDVLAADDGAARDYPARLAALDLATLSADQIGNASDVLRAILRQHRFPFHQPWQADEEAPEPTAYDYILVDSRTGLTEIGGLCVGPLADRLIVLCGLNDQNVFGTQQFLQLVGLQASKDSLPQERWDAADPLASDTTRPATLGPKPTLLVASPVPFGEMALRAQRLADLQERIGLRPLRLSYHSQMALMETVFVRDHMDEYLALEYRALAQQVMAMVDDAPAQWEARLQKTFRPAFGKNEAKPDQAEAPQQLARLAVSKGDLSPYKFVALQFAPEETAQQTLDQLRWVAVHLASTRDEEAEAWLDWADALDTEPARQTGDPMVFESMNAKYSKAIALKPDFHGGLKNWGVALNAWAQQKQGAEADGLFIQAAEKCSQAWALKPDDHEILFNWGIILSAWAKQKQGAEASGLFAQAADKYSQAWALKPDDHKVLNNWGVMLSAWAQQKQGTEAADLFAQAADKYSQALALKPDYSGVHFNLGCLAALQGDVLGAILALEKWKALDATAIRANLDNETDFDRVRESPAFQAFRESLPE